MDRRSCCTHSEIRLYVKQHVIMHVMPVTWNFRSRIVYVVGVLSVSWIKINYDEYTRL